MSANRVELEPAWVLHTRQYRETSLLIEVFSANHGRLGLIARGARRPKSPLKALLQPFEPLAMSWSGRGDLGTLQQAEAVPGRPPLALQGLGLAGGFYANELLIKLLERRDPHPVLFGSYSQLIEQLADPATVEPGLRQFELLLLRELGFGINLSVDAFDLQPLSDESLYEYRLEQGVVPVHDGVEGAMVFKGSTLRAIEASDWSSPDTLRAAKKLLRYTIDHYLDGRELKTRKVYAAMSAQLR